MDSGSGLEFFSVITYITEYYCKDDTGTTAFLNEAVKQCSILTTQQQRRCLKNVFLTHRQFGIFEAFMKIFPEMRLKDSNVGVEYVPLGKPEEVSHYLVRADDKRYYDNTELFEIDDREGLYYEKPNMVQKYLRRGDTLEDLCLAQFVKMYDACHSPKKPHLDEDDDYAEKNKTDKDNYSDKDTVWRSSEVSSTYSSRWEVGNAPSIHH